LKARNGRAALRRALLRDDQLDLTPAALIVFREFVHAR
jgi:hypothetical protein